MAHGLVGYIPAKGRSRGIASKNMALLGGRPLVEHTIRFALECGLLDTVFVSTESPPIRALADACGADVIERPEHLASDSTRIAEVLANDIPVMEQRAGPFELIACLIPTSPLRRLRDLETGIALARDAPEAPGVVSLGTLPCGIQQVIALDDTSRRIGAVFGIDNLTGRSQRQSHDKLYYPNGSIVVVRKDAFRKSPSFYVENSTIGFPIDAVSGLDIDSPDDLQLAELILRGMESQRSRQGS
jgi:CMP-N-acetylneuraminic acid synthetase